LRLSVRVLSKYEVGGRRRLIRYALSFRACRDGNAEATNQAMSQTDNR
jgi:hypothetical protein